MTRKVTDRVTGIFFVYTIPPLSRSYVECTGGAANPIWPPLGPVLKNCGVRRSIIKSLCVSRQSIWAKNINVANIVLIGAATDNRQLVISSTMVVWDNDSGFTFSPFDLQSFENWCQGGDVEITMSMKWLAWCSKTKYGSWGNCNWTKLLGYLQFLCPIIMKMVSVKYPEDYRALNAA